MKKIQRGSAAGSYVFFILVVIIIAGVGIIGGLHPAMSPNSGEEVNIVSPTSGATYNNLQLKTFGYVTIAPSPTLTDVSIPSSGQPPLGQTALCQPGGSNNEPEIISATTPASGQSVSATGQIKIWVDDEGAPIIAQGETTNSDGSISNPGNQNGKALDNYLFEPALYLDLATAESGGSPHFPNYIKGQFNNNPADQASGFAVRNVTNGAAIEAPPAGASSCLPSTFFKCYKAEYVWNVSGLGLTPGTHRAEFVIHDGDFDRGVGCVNIQIQ